MTEIVMQEVGMGEDHSPTPPPQPWHGMCVRCIQVDKYGGSDEDHSPGCPHGADGHDFASCEDCQKDPALAPPVLPAGVSMEMVVGKVVGSAGEVEVTLGQVLEHFGRCYTMAANSVADVIDQRSEAYNLDNPNLQPELFAARLINRAVSEGFNATEIVTRRDQTADRMAAVLVELTTGKVSLRDAEEAAIDISHDALTDMVDDVVTTIRGQLLADAARYLVPRLREQESAQ